jgi:hypothetical protein
MNEPQRVALSGRTESATSVNYNLVHASEVRTPFFAYESFTEQSGSTFLACAPRY